MAMNDQIRKVAIVGRDLDGWMTAFFLKSVLDKSRGGYDITFIDLGTQLTAHDFYAVLPSYKMLHKTLGANEEKLRATAKASVYFGQRFSGWNPDLPDFFHAYDRHGIDFNGVDFFQYWIKATQNGLKLPLEEFSLGVAAAKHRRFVAGADEKGFSHAAHGYHLSASEYVDAIARAAKNAGVKHITGYLKSIHRDDEHIESLELQDGAVIKADFYIDASGSDARLIGALSDKNSDQHIESWDHWFHCDRIVTASSGPLSPTPAFSQITALSNGWCGLYPLQNRTAVQALYSSEYTEFDKVAEEIKTRMGAEIHDAGERKIKCRILKRPWIGNCLAVGSAAAVLEPLDALQQHALVISIVMLRQLFPNSEEYDNERKVYNHKIHSFIENLRNFQLAHYALNSRKEPFWQACRDADIPDALGRKVALFRDYGYASILEDETFQEENWISVFNGHGLTPASYSPLVDNMEEADMIRGFQKILATIKNKIESSSVIDNHR